MSSWKSWRIRSSGLYNLCIHSDLYIQFVQSGNVEETAFANLEYGFVVPVRVEPAQLLSQPVVQMWVNQNLWVVSISTNNQNSVNVGQSIKTWIVSISTISTVCQSVQCQSILGCASINIKYLDPARISRKEFSTCCAL